MREPQEVAVPITYIYNPNSRTLHRHPGLREDCNTDQIKRRRTFRTLQEVATALSLRNGVHWCRKCWPLKVPDGEAA